MKKQAMTKAEKVAHKNARKSRANARGKGWKVAE